MLFRSARLVAAQGQYGGSARESLTLSNGKTVRLTPGMIRDIGMGKVQPLAYDPTDRQQLIANLSKRVEWIPAGEREQKWGRGTEFDAMMKVIGAVYAAGSGIAKNYFTGNSPARKDYEHLLGAAKMNSMVSKVLKELGTPSELRAFLATVTGRVNREAGVRQYRNKRS